MPLLHCVCSDDEYKYYKVIFIKQSMFVTYFHGFGSKQLKHSKQEEYWKTVKIYNVDRKDQSACDEEFISNMDEQQAYNGSPFLSLKLKSKTSV